MRPPSSAPLDPVLLEVLRHELLAVSEEMNITMRRTTRSVVAKESNDFSSALLAADGTLVMQAVPYGLRVFAQGMPHILAKFGGRFEPGDVIITNDPYQGLSHLPDIMVVSPAFWQGELVGFAATYQHHTDIGGRFPGGFGTQSRELYEEGLQLPAVHFVRAGRPETSVHDIIRANVRAPDDVLGDLEANAAACRRGAAGLTELCERYGRDALERCIRHFVATTEQCLRDLTTSLPDGRYARCVTYDDGAGTRFDLALALVVDGDQLTVDLTGTSPQVDSAFNIPPGLVVDVICGSLLGLMPHPELVVNAGLVNGFTLVEPPGSVVHPHFPAAVASRAQALMLLTDMMYEVLADAAPDRMPAAGEGGATIFIFTSPSVDGRPPGVLTDIWCGGWGARPDRDGIDGVVMISANGFRTSSGEIMELESPVALDGFGFVSDTGGPGRYRGNASLFRRFRVKHDGRAMLRTTRVTGIADGRDGGQPGGGFHATLTRDGVTTPLPRMSMIDVEVRAGDVIEHVVSGGSGIGDPFTRDPHAVLRDVLDDKVSIAGAARDYGVVIAADDRRIDHAATAALRARTTR